MQRDNLALEEDVLFPMAEACLSAADWLSIAERQKARENLLEGQELLLRYEAWRQFLLAG